MAFWMAIESSCRLLWERLHKNEILWAVIVGLPLAAYFAIKYDQSEPQPYHVYIVIGPRMPNTIDKARERLLGSMAFQGVMVNGRRVALQAKDIYYDSSSTSQEALEATRRAANEILEEHDALAVVGILDSTPTEELLRVLFSQRPSVPFIATVQSDENLLQKCPNCSDASEEPPFLQLSPTNADEARWAIQFAIDRQISSFLIVKDSEESNDSYVKGLADRYAEAIDISNNANHTNLHKHTIGLTEATTNPRSLNAPCLLYAGGTDGAATLLSLVRSSKSAPIVILSDSAVPIEPPSEKQAENFGLVDASKHSMGKLLDQSDATDFNGGVNVYGMDGIAIVAQLIDDMNVRGLDWRLRAASTMRLDGVNDVRRNLVRVFRENLRFRSSYVGARETAPMPGFPAVYSFSGHRRLNGLFHVWEWDPDKSLFKDIDNWHPRRPE